MVSENTIQLLNGSETFLGVLLTVVLLFIFMNKRTNFVLVLLAELEKSVSVQIKKLVNITGDKSLFNSSDYKLATRFVNEPEEDSNKELKEKGRKLLAQILIERQKILNEFTRAADINNYQKVFRFNNSTNGHVLVPVYTICFSISAFIYDEILKSSYIGTSDLLLSSLAVFILLSFILCGIIWTVYVLSVRCVIKRIVNKDKSSAFCFWETIKQAYDRFITKLNLKTRWYSLLFYMVCMFLVWIIFLIINKQWVHSYFFMVLGLVMPYIFIGLLRMSIRKQKCKYTYLFVCGHYILIVFLSILYAITILNVADFFSVHEQMIYPVYNYEPFKLAILLFVLLNGIVAPFVIPGIGYRIVCWDARMKTRKSRKRIKKWSKKYTKSLNEFCSNIPDTPVRTP